MNRICFLLISFLVTIAVIAATGARVQMEKSVKFNFSPKNWIADKAPVSAKDTVKWSAKL